MPRLRAAALLFVGTWGCQQSPGVDDPCSGEGTPTVEFGTGASEYQSLRSVDQSYELVHGPQGSFHLVLGFSATHLDATSLILADVQAVGSDGTRVADSSLWLDMRCRAGVGLQSWGSFLVVDGRPEDLHGIEVVLRAELEDAQGTLVSAETVAMIYDPQFE